MLSASLQREKLTYTSWLSYRDKSSDCSTSKLTLSNSRKQKTSNDTLLNFTMAPDISLSNKHSSLSLDIDQLKSEVMLM